ncbi:MAG: NAD-dependent epimerase/dehydratase family protein [Moorea sp. SIO3I7]|uniref:GDP-mannose 4,6-dehydratase n=1 Tax=unclassified Moorena TaxID=2683338 RepID=UPI0013C151E2|nr:MULTISPECIES: GDP-mannose 4,6-dehydratase [unclassified Moorena]NEN94797.1 NAD-dependent epimerase/dehydratase family protein [Moorena sp. SIO3I7]NEO05750.1 NAD-dependent epimerase/dehydratase family protein [Moorena sp. SIO3I8]NEO22860.1 NAD-dependent epimerase/dehydratase family protein [Moorena sp. SIO4A5]NEP25079.1 NAD-dependent epimerase/dehydratase family protein [Moorena sp. SIO3I6]NEQ61688.1 NAD-dependent epimerase/dehydratase family protein [Moorena sp. SIO4A1]
MTVLVTGAGGFIASHLVEMLLQNGHQVRALVRYNSQGSWGHLQDIQPQLRENLEVCLGDITDPYFVTDLVANCEVVFHLAALIGIPYSYHAPASYLATNTGGTLNILQACRQKTVRRVIITSTSEVYGTALYTPMREDHPLQAQSPYAASKIAADKLAESFFCTYDLPVVTLRPFNTYGPRQSARAIIPTVLSQAMAGTNTIRLGNLTPKRDLTFVLDTARAFLLASEASGIEGETIHFGQGNAVSVAEIAHTCLKVVNSHAEIISTAERQRPKQSEVDLLLCDASNAKQRLGWQPQVSLEAGLLQVAEYMKQHQAQYRNQDYVV